MLAAAKLVKYKILCAHFVSLVHDPVHFHYVHVIELGHDCRLL